MKICHLTSAHPRFDTRIFHKMCSSLVKEEFDVTLIVADGRGNEVSQGVKIIDSGSSKSRLDRMLNAPSRVYAEGKNVSADLYHLHDPELIPIGLKLKRMGEKVVFDAHEDVPKQLLSKPYLNRPSLWVLAKFFSRYEKWACKHFDGIIGATPYIREKFLEINPNAVNINNFPLLSELSFDGTWADKHREVCYVGGIEKIRGIVELCEAMAKVPSDIKLNLCGDFGDSALRDAVVLLPGWRSVREHGFLDRGGVRNILGRSMAGLVTLHGFSHFRESLPIKMFEYMSAGIPIIASNFPFWREIVVGNDCGLLVDPCDPYAIADAIKTLVDDPVLAQQKGENGRKAVEQKYNWEIEAEKLVDFYRQILT